MKKLRIKRGFLSLFLGFFIHFFIFSILFLYPHEERVIKKKPVKISFVKPSLNPVVLNKKEIQDLKKGKSRYRKEKTLKKKLKKDLKKFSFSMEAIVESDVAKVSVEPKEESWAYGSKEGKDSKKRERLVFDASDPSQISVLPILLYEPSKREMQSFYPEKAKREGIEANVELLIQIEKNGVVSKVSVVKSSEDSFTEIAVELAKKFRFKPARRDEELVAVLIPWTYKFRLD